MISGRVRSTSSERSARKRARAQPWSCPEVLSRNLRDRRAVARYAGLTGAPDESGRRRREKGLAKAGNARVRRGMIQLAWRFLLHPEGECIGPVVSGAHGRGPGRHAQDPDRGAGEKAADCAVAHGDHRRGSARRCPASGRLRSLPEGDYPDSIRAAFPRDRGPMTIRGGGAPSGSMAFRPQWRMDPPLRSFAADAYDCIMVWILSIRRIQACGAMVCALWRVPFGSLCTEPKPGCSKRG